MPFEESALQTEPKTTIFSQERKLDPVNKRSMHILKCQEQLYMSMMES